MSEVLPSEAFVNAYLDALAIELNRKGYGVLDKEMIARKGDIRLSREHGPNVTAIIDIAFGGGHIWFKFNDITYLAQQFSAPDETGDAKRDSVAIDSAVAWIMATLTFRSDLDPLSKEEKAA
ncbi:MAG: hypothetical protein WDN29_10250 [Methylovirgula sp.]|jgi:hypothetical protein